MKVGPQAPTHSPPDLLWWGIGLLVGALYLSVAAFHVAYASLNVDEGFYAAATRAVWQGEVPYRDFGFTQPPLVAYFNAPLLGLTGFGLFQQRAINALWSLLAVLLAARMVSRRAGPGPALLLIALFALTPAWMNYTSLGKTYGLASLLVMIASTVFLESKPGWRQVTALSAIGVLGAGCRLPAAPLFALLWLAALFAGGRPSPRLIAIAVSAAGACTLAFFLPFYLSAPEQFKFWIVDFHRVSVPLKDWRLHWTQLLAFAPSIWAVAIVAIGFAIARGHWRRREIALMVAAAVALATNLLPRGVYDEYGAPFLPPLATGALLVLTPWIAELSRPMTAAFASSLLLVPLAMIPAINWRRLEPVQKQFPSFWLPTNTRPYNFKLPENIGRARAIVQRLLPTGQPFIGPHILLAIEADRPIPRTMRMGAFTFSFDYEADQADRLHLMTHAEFEKQLRDPAVPLIGMHVDNTFNYSWSVPSFTYQTPEALNAWGMLVARSFAPVYADTDSVIFARPHLLPSNSSR